MRQDEDLREPLVGCQGGQVSVRVVRGSASGSPVMGEDYGSQSPCRVGTGESGLVLCGGLELRLTTTIIYIYKD